MTGAAQPGGSEPAHGRPPSAPARPRGAVRALRFAGRHWRLLARLTLLLLVVVVVLQNVEPTSLDFLFWRLAAFPKLVLIVGSMAVGAFLWEILSHLVRTGRGRSRTS